MSDLVSIPKAVKKPIFFQNNSPAGGGPDPRLPRRRACGCVRRRPGCHAHACRACVRGFGGTSQTPRVADGNAMRVLCVFCMPKQAWAWHPAVPTGLAAVHRDRHPSDESLGYFQTPRRGCSGALPRDKDLTTISSPNGATENSQGRQPLENDPNNGEAPAGRQRPNRQGTPCRDGSVLPPFQGSPHRAERYPGADAPGY